MSLDKSNWTPEHHATHKAYRGLIVRLDTIDLELERFIQNTESIRKKIDKELTELQDKCKHIDDGGILIATCSICGWADTYGAL